MEVWGGRVVEVDVEAGLDGRVVEGVWRCTQCRMHIL